MMHKTNDVLHSIISDIQENILIKLFGSEHVNIKTLLLMSSQIVEHANEYEFEMRYVDGGGSVSRDTWVKFNNSFNDEISLVSYDDDIIFTHHTNVPLRDIHFRSFKNSNKYERKMVISRIRSRPESKKVLPLSVRLSRETPMSPANELQSYDNIQRRQRYTYQFKDPSLSNWRIDKTIRLFTESVDDKKLHFKPGIDNIDTLKYYDSLDIEFEYIGEFSMICTEFFRLIEKIYTPFEDFDMKYNFVKHVFNKCGVSFESLFSLIPLPAIMTNGILQHLNVNDFSFSYRINGEHSIFIVIINGNRKENLSKSDILMISIADGSMRHVYGSLDLLTQTVNQHPANEDEKIPRRLVSFMMHEDKTIAPLVYVFEAECITDKNEFILIDTMLYKSKNMLNNILPDRIACIDKFMKLKNNFIKTHISKNKLINMRGKSIDSLLLSLHTRESGDIYDSTCLVCKQIDASLPESLVYKMKSNSTSLSIDFKICYVPRKKAFYLYVTGILRNVIKNKTVMNEMSLEHFGYSLINAQSNREVYLLFVSPYMKNSHVFKPRLEWDSSTIDATTRNKIDILMRDIVENPLRYNHMIVKMIKVSDGWVPLSACGYTNDYLEYINRNSSITALTKSFLSCPSFTGNIDIEVENGKRMKDISRSSSYLKMMNHLAIPHAYREALNISSLIYDNINSRNFQLNERGKRLKMYSNHMRMRSFLTGNQAMLMKSLYALIDQYLIEKFMNAYDYENILDIFSEEHVNVSLIFELSSCKYLYGVNSEKGNLSAYVDAGVFRNESKIASPLINKVQIHNTTRVLNINIIDSDINGRCLLNKLNEQCEYFPKSIDLIMLHNNFKSLDSVLDFIEFKNVCLDILSPNGKILIVAYDGDKIERLTSQHNRKQKIKIEEFQPLDYIVKTVDDCVVPSPAAMYAISGTHLNDSYQYQHRNIDHVKDDSRDYINVTCNSTARMEKVTIKYKALTIELIPPLQYENIDMNDLGVVALYYYKFNRFSVARGRSKDSLFLTFKSNKIIGKMMTLNIARVLNVTVELSSNIYDKCLQDWFSVYHNVDKLFGSLGYTQDVILSGIDRNVLIETKELNEDVKSFILSRRNDENVTVVITKQLLSESEQESYSFDYVKRIRGKGGSVRAYMYAYFPRRLTGKDRKMLSMCVDEAIDVYGDERLMFKYYIHPNVVKNCVEPLLIFKSEMMRVFNDGFKVCDYCVPLTQSEVSTFISYNRKFSKLDEVEDYVNCMVAYCLERSERETTEE